MNEINKYLHLLRLHVLFSLICVSIGLFVGVGLCYMIWYNMRNDVEKEHVGKFGTVRGGNWLIRSKLFSVRLELWVGWNMEHGRWTNWCCCCCLFLFPFLLVTDWDVGGKITKGWGNDKWGKINNWYGHQSWSYCWCKWWQWWGWFLMGEHKT